MVDEWDVSKLPVFVCREERVLTILRLEIGSEN